MPRVEWVGQSIKDPDNGQTDPSRLINCYRERLGDKIVIKSVLGTTPFANLDGVFMRALARIDNKMIVAHGGSLWSVSERGVATLLGAIENASDTTLSGNNGSIAVTAGGEYFVWDGTAMSSPTIGAFSAYGSGTFFGQSTVITEKDGRRITWSGVADAATFDADDVITAEQRDDNIVRALPIAGLLWVFKETSIERFALTGGLDFITPVSASLLEPGLAGFNLLTEMPNGAAFVGSDGVFYVVLGGQMRPVSTRGVESSIRVSVPETVFYYEDEGHKCIVIQFNDRPAWIYDLSMGEWHERARGIALEPWDVVASVNVYGKAFVGRKTGEIYELARVNQDASEPLLRRAVSRTMEFEGRRFIVPKLEVMPTVGRSYLGRETAEVLGLENGEVLGLDDLALGFDLSSTAPRDAKMDVRTSKDRGETWGQVRRRSLGDQGDYNKTVVLRSLGQFRKMNVEITMADATEVVIDAQAFVEVA